MVPGLLPSPSIALLGENQCMAMLCEHGMPELLLVPKSPLMQPPAVGTHGKSNTAPELSMSNLLYAAH